MPVILDPDSYNLWLDPGMKDVGAASQLLRPCLAGLMRSYSVSTRINHVANNDEECSAPVELAEVQAPVLIVRRWPVATWNSRSLRLLHQYDNFFIAAVLGIQIQQHVNDLISSNESVGQLFRMLFIAVSIDEDVRLLSLIRQSKLQCTIT